jgi:MFS-type transporter involved in bile tolerance (Atg22 family)
MISIVVAMPKVPRRPDPEPLETDDRPVVIVGIILWALAFAVLVVFFRDDLRRHDAAWWLWACVIGVALGLYGLRFTSRRQRR